MYSVANIMKWMYILVEFSRTVVFQLPYNECITQFYHKITVHNLISKNQNPCYLFALLINKVSVLRLEMIFILVVITKRIVIVYLENIKYEDHITNNSNQLLILFKWIRL